MNNKELKPGFNLECSEDDYKSYYYSTDKQEWLSIVNAFNILFDHGLKNILQSSLYTEQIDDICITRLIFQKIENQISSHN